MFFVFFSPSVGDSYVRCWVTPTLSITWQLCTLTWAHCWLRLSSRIWWSSVASPRCTWKAELNNLQHLVGCHNFNHTLWDPKVCFNSVLKDMGRLRKCARVILVTWFLDYTGGSRTHCAPHLVINLTDVFWQIPAIAHKRARRTHRSAISPQNGSETMSH